MRGAPQDIESEETVEKDSAFLASIVESSDDAIISKTLDGTISSWNKGAERIFGYRAEEVIGKRIYILIPPELAQEEVGILARLKRGQRIDHYETLRVRKDGTRLNVSLTVSPVKDKTGQIIGASKIARDITERKEFQRRLQQEQERMRVTFSSIGDGVIVTDLVG